MTSLINEETPPETSAEEDSTGNHILRGHTNGVLSASFSPDGATIVSGSYDSTLRLWDVGGLVGGARDRGASEGEVYRNAKVLLVGDSGVGKSGLAMRLTEDRFAATISTHGAWATVLPLPANDATGMDNHPAEEREVWLWDFGGQADYRLVHQLFMDETALAVLVFDPQHTNPFEGIGQWDKDLTRAARRSCRKLLVAGRCDRGGITVSDENIRQFCTERDFADFRKTSAQTGDGCAELREAILNTIDWSAVPKTVSPRIFKRLKEEILKLRDAGKAVLHRDTLLLELQNRMPGETFAPEQYNAVLSLLSGPGLIWQLDFGDFVLLRPEWINAYAGAMVRSVRAYPGEIGCIAEDDVLSGTLDYQDMTRLPRNEEEIVLRAMYQTCLKHALCLRENTDQGPRLVFPAYFRRERPVQDSHPAPFVTYGFSGMLEEIYATLVVRLHHTKQFQTAHLWRNAADFKTLSGQQVGLKLSRQSEGAGELTIYCDPALPIDTQVAFTLYAHDHIQSKATNITRERRYICPHCGFTDHSRTAIVKRLNRGDKDLRCGDCDKFFPLWDAIEERFAAPEMRQKVRDMEAEVNSELDNQSRERLLVGDVTRLVASANHIFRETPHTDWGIDGEIEFKDVQSRATGKRVYLQLKSGDSYLRQRQRDNAEVFDIPKDHHIDYWMSQPCDVWLIIRTSDGRIRWMNVTESLKRQTTRSKQVVFTGEEFTVASIQRVSRIV